MSYTPANIAHLEVGSLETGKPADVVVINPNKKYIISAADFCSKGHNTPFIGQEVYGEVVATICDGKILKYNR